MSTSTPPQKTSVAIIGAGLSGLATAACLRDIGIPCIIYEAQSQPGGRVRTVQSSQGKKLDLGATWFHGTVDNVALDLAVESGAVPQPPSPLGEHMSRDDRVDNEYGSLVFSTPGVHVLPSGEIRSLDPAVSQQIVQDYATQLYSMDSFLQAEASPDVSVLDLMKKATGYGEMSALQRAIFKSRDLVECTVNGCNASTGKLSANRFNDYVELPGDNLRPGEEGMSVVVAALMAKLEYPQVVMDAEVTSIAWGLAAKKPGSELVKIGFRDGKTAYAECVIWTASLNVTKRAIADGLFSPALPGSKIDALDGRDQGTIDKVFAMLKEPLKGIVANCAIPVVWELDLTDVRIGVRSMTWQKCVYALTYDNKRNAIVFWLSGEGALSFERLGYEEKMSQVSTMLTQLLQQEVVLEEVVNSTWGTNRFTRGSYSYPLVGCDRHGIEEILTALPGEDTPVLYFAGEATHRTMYSTMHGAVESGYREAERCSRFMEDVRRKGEGMQRH